MAQAERDPLVNPYVIALLQQRHVPLAVAVRVLLGEPLDAIRARTNDHELNGWVETAKDDWEQLRRIAERSQKRRGLLHQLAAQNNVSSQTVNRLLFSAILPEQLDKYVAHDRLLACIGKPTAQYCWELAGCIFDTYEDGADILDPEKLKKILSTRIAKRYARLAKQFVNENGTGEANQQAAPAWIDKRLRVATERIWNRAVDIHAYKVVKRQIKSVAEQRHVAEAWSQRQSDAEQEVAGILADCAYLEQRRVKIDSQAWPTMVEQVLDGLSNASAIRLSEDALRARIQSVLERRLDARTHDLWSEARDRAWRMRRIRKQQREDECIRRDLVRRYANDRCIDPVHFKQCLNKTDIADLLGLDECESQHQRPWPLVRKLCAQLEHDEAVWRRLCETHRKSLALSSLDVERRLAITRAERQRWTHEQRLPVVCYETMGNNGRALNLPRYAYDEIVRLTPDVTEQWRNQWRARAADKHRDRRRTKWAATHDPYALATLEVSLWTMWASRWAKRNQMIKEKELRTQTGIYEARARQWYEKKDCAVALLASTPYARLSKYIPDSMYWESVDLCDHHLNELQDKSTHSDANSRDRLIKEKASDIRACEDCVVHTHEDHKKLYYIEILVTGVNDKFSFHTPYARGAEFLPDFEILPTVEHDGGEYGEFRFGRSVKRKEMMLFPEEDVERNLDAAMDKLRVFTSAGANNTRRQKSLAGGMTAIRAILVGWWQKARPFGVKI